MRYTSGYPSLGDRIANLFDRFMMLSMWDALDRWAAVWRWLDVALFVILLAAWMWGIFHIHTTRDMAGLFLITLSLARWK